MKISVLIPLHNQEKYVDECIESVINQTYKDIEIIIIDDGSTDRSYKIASNFLYDERVALIKQTNLGLGETRNKLIKQATGDFVFHLDSDDYIAIDCIENMVKLQKEFDYDLVFSNFLVVDNSKKITKKIKRHRFLNKDTYIKFFLAGLGYKSVCNTFIRRELYLENNINVPNLNYGEDWSVIYKLVFYSIRIGHTNKYTYFYRKNMESLTYNISSDVLIMKKIDDIFRIKQEYVRFLDMNSSFSMITNDIKSFDIEIKNAIFSLLVRNKRSEKWYIENVKARYDSIKQTKRTLSFKNFLFKKCIRVLLLQIKRIILIINNLKGKSR